MNADAKLVGIAPEGTWRDCQHDHFVQFYEDDAVLVDSVVEYVAHALNADGTAVVVATAEHLDLFERRWSEDGIDVASAREQGRYVAMEAAATLEQLLRDGSPDADAFAKVIEPVIAAAVARGRPVHAFGEMVTLLWEQQRYDAALRLETLWADLARRQTFSLFCAYPLKGDMHAPVQALRQVCGIHGRAIPTERYSHLSKPADRLAEICELQNKALLLDRELAHTSHTNELRALAAAIVESSDDAIISKTLSSRITSWNPGAERLFGYSAEEMVGEPITRLIPAELLYEEDEILAKLARGERIDHYETQRVGKDGRRLEISLSVSPIRNTHGEIVGAASVARDISERKRAERGLREKEMQLQAEADALAKLNELSTRLWRAKSLSEGLDEMLRALLELLGADKGNIQLLEPERNILTIQAQCGFDESFLEYFREVSIEDESACGRALRTGERIIIEDVETDKPYESLRPIARAADYRAVLSTPLVAVDGRPLGIASTHFREPHRPGEQQLRRLDLYLRQASDFIQRCGLEQALRENAETMRQADRRKDEFLALLAHELRNPLAPIRYALATAKKGGRTAEQMRRADEIIDRQVSHMSRLLDDLLDVSRITRGTLELKKTRTELTAVIATAIEAARPTLDKKGHTLSVKLPVDPVRLTCGHDVEVAFSGRSALAMAEEFRPQAVVLDIGMPEMDGYEVARQLRAKAWAKDLRLIAVTGWGQERDKERAAEAGFDLHLTKPVDPLQLEPMLAR